MRRRRPNAIIGKRTPGGCRLCAKRAQARLEKAEAERDHWQADAGRLQASREEILARLAKADTERDHWQADAGRLQASREEILAQLAKAEAELVRVEAEQERWQAFQQSRTFRAMQLYFRSYTLPVIGPMLRWLRRTTGMIVRGIGRR